MPKINLTFEKLNENNVLETAGDQVAELFQEYMSRYESSIENTMQEMVNIVLNDEHVELATHKDKAIGYWYGETMHDTQMELYTIFVTDNIKYFQQLAGIQEIKHKNDMSHVLKQRDTCRKQIIKRASIYSKEKGLEYMALVPQYKNRTSGNEEALLGEMGFTRNKRDRAMVYKL